MIRRAAATVAAVAIVGCGEPSSPPPPPPPPGTLVVEPPNLALSETKRTDKFFISSTPSGSEVTWQLAQKPDWLTVSPDRGKASVPVEITVTGVGLDTLPAGGVVGSVRIVSNGGGGGLTVAVEIKAIPQVGFSTPTVAFDETEASKHLYLKNTGNTFFEWTATDIPSWLTVQPTSGYLYRKDSVRLEVRPDRFPLPGGVTAGSIRIQTNPAMATPQALPVTVAVPATPVPATSVTRLAFVPGTNTAKLTVYNRGKGALAWTAFTPVSWISLVPNHGNLAVGDSSLVSVTVDRSQVAGNYVEVNGRIDGNGQPASLSVQFVISSLTSLAPGNLYGVAPTVVDAEYDLAGDRVIAVGTSPNALLVLDATIPRQVVVSLPATPTAVSIRPDGRYAAIGHDGAVTLFDLTTMTVVRTVATQADVLDLVLAANNWAYVFPRRDQWVAMRNVNLITGADLPSESYPPLYAGTVGRLHPNGRHIYLADNNLSPSDFLKYQIADTLAERLYDSPYHGDYSFNGNLWFNQDGSQLIARSGNIFRSTTDRATDMTYVGKLAGVGDVTGAVHSGPRGRIYVLGQPAAGGPAPELRVHSVPFFGYLGTASMPTVTTGLGTFPTWGRFVFLSADHTRLVLLVEADQAAALAQRWSLVYYLTASLP